MGCPYGVASDGGELIQAVPRNIAVNRRAGKSEVMMQADTLELHRNAVDEEAFP